MKNRETSFVLDKNAEIAGGRARLAMFDISAFIDVTAKGESMGAAEFKEWTNGLFVVEPAKSK